MSLFRKREKFIPSKWGEPDDPDTRTQDIIATLSFEVTRLMGVTEQLQDLVATINEDRTES